MTLATILTADSPRALLDQLERDIGDAPLSPFAVEQIIVQSLGMERWVRNELALRQGVAASLKFPFPAGFCHGLARDLHRGTGDSTEFVLDTAFEEERLTWRIFEWLDEPTFVSEPVCGPLRGYLFKADAQKRFSLAQRIAKQFDDYLLYRPDVLLDWEDSPVAADEPEHVRWQSHLWRLLTNGEHPMHLARWFVGAIEQLEQTAVAPKGLPTRLSVFGVSTLPPLFVRLLHAIGRFVPVRFYVLAPNDARRDGSLGNPLFAAFGGASRDLLEVLTASSTPPVCTAIDTAPQPPSSLLGWLQHDIRHGISRRPDNEPHTPILRDDADSSLLVHVCHSPMREMEVLRDQLLTAFATDPTLRPHDVLVLVPDTNVYAPLATSVFGGGDADMPAIPHRVAERSVAQEASPAQAMLQLLKLVTARGAASEVVGLLHLPCVGRAAGVDTADMDRIIHWMEQSTIRWGWDGETRARAFGLPAIDDNSWRRGLDRLLTGYATGRIDALVGGALPVAGDTMGDVELLGRLVEWVEQLFATLESLRAAHSLAHWCELLASAFDWLVVAEGADEQAAIDDVLDAVRNLGEMPQMLTPSLPVDFDVIRNWLERSLNAEAHGTGFMVGGMTICAIKPMRSIPFRVIAMLGLDDSSFPRASRRSAFDLVEMQRRSGDRDGRQDDRQLFLDTLLCAEQQLILSYVGRSQKNNSAIAASVVISELLDTIDASFITDLSDEKGRTIPVSQRMVVEHRLQPFSPAYFDASDDRLFSYSASTAHSVAAAQQRLPVAPFLSQAEMDRRADRSSGGILDVSLQDLIACWLNPAKFYSTQTLGLRIPGDHEELDDAEPMEIDALARTILQQRMLDRHLAGEADTTREMSLALATGDLPSGALAAAWHTKLRGDLGGFLDRVGRPLFREPITIDCVGEGWRLTGRVDGIVDGGRLQVRAATLKSKDLVRAWITHVALCAEHAGQTTTVTGTDESVVFEPVLDPTAMLDFLIGEYANARVAPLPFFLVASQAHQRTRLSTRAKSQPIDAAASAYEGTEHAAGDATDPYVALCWRGRSPIDACADRFIEITTTFWDAMDASRKKESTPDAESVE